MRYFFLGIQKNHPCHINIARMVFKFRLLVLFADTLKLTLYFSEELQFLPAIQPYYMPPHHSHFR